MKLTELEAKFIRYGTRREEAEMVVGDPATWRERGCPTERRMIERPYHAEVETLEQADGVRFLCPKCFAENNGPVGTHMVICWFTGKVPDTAAPGPGRWNPQGTGLEDLTFVPPGAVSVLLLGGCDWHGFVKHGDAA